MGKWECVLFRWTDGNRMICSVHFVTLWAEDYNFCNCLLVHVLFPTGACPYALIARSRILYIFVSRSTWTSCMPSATVALWNWTLDSCDSYYVHFVETKGNEKDKNKTAQKTLTCHDSDLSIKSDTEHRTLLDLQNFQIIFKTIALWTFWHIFVQTQCSISVYEICNVT